MTSRERVLAAVRGAPVDRPPFAVWRHFYAAERRADTLADALVSFAKRHALDLVKHNPRAQYHAEPWGTRWRYDGDAHPTLERYAVTAPAAWARVDRRPVAGALAEIVESVRLVRRALPDVPLLATVFTPVAILERLSGRERLLADLRERPDDVVPALEAVTETFRDLVRGFREAGADGIFLATTAWARRDVLTDAEYARFGRPYDLRLLDAARGAALNVLHVCGANARVVELADEPVAAVSWSVHAGGTPDLETFLERVPDRGAIGGISDDALRAPSTDPVRREIAAGLAATRGRRWIAAGGCTVPPESRAEDIDAARRALEAA